MRNLSPSSPLGTQAERAREILEQCERRAESHDQLGSYADLLNSPADAAIAVELMKLLCDQRIRRSHPKVYALAKAAILELLDSSANHRAN